MKATPIRDVLNRRKILGWQYGELSVFAFYSDGPWFDAGSNYGDTYRYNPRTKEVIKTTEKCSSFAVIDPPLFVAEMMAKIDAFVASDPSFRRRWKM